MRQRIIKTCVLLGCGMLLQNATAYAGTAPSPLPVVNQQQTVKGTVVDNTGEPLIGVTVRIEGQTGTGAVTDIDGNFSINAPKGAKLHFSYVGFKDVVLDATPQMNVTMGDENNELKEVVVVGYGVQKKESLTGAVSVVDAKAFQEKGALSSPLQALQGTVPGVIITRSSSAPGDESWSMNLRGAASVNSTAPLIIIDGVAAGSVNELRNLNSNDIENISFLKDGSAAIYGSRAAGGVVLITTKQGKSGKVRIDYSGSATLKTVGLMPNLMSLDEWAEGVKQTLTNDNNTSSVWYTYADLCQKYKGSYLDLSKTASPFGSAAFTDVSDFVFSEANWLDELFGNSWNTEHSISASGGSDKNTYRVSFTYSYAGSPLQYGDNNNKRFNFRVNDVYQFTPKIKLTSSIAYNRQEQVTPTMVSSALTNTYPMPGLPFATQDGKPYAWGTWGSPIAKLMEGGDNKLSVSEIKISETLNYDITDWLTANASFGFNNGNAYRNSVQNAITYYNYVGSKVVLTDPVQANSKYTQTSGKTDFYHVSGYVNGHKKFGKHNTALMLGTEYEFTDYTYFGAAVKDIQQGLEIVNGSGDVTLTGNENRYQTSILSFYGRANYDYDSRYLLEFNGRYDGSSKFLSENRWNFFWGVSAGWRISEEPFMKDVTWLSNLKLRASYAEMGNQSGIGNYDGVQLYNLKTASGAYVGSEKLSYIATSGTLASTTRTWERIKNYNVALDFGLFNGALTGTFEAFMKRNNNMLVSVTYPATLGDKAPSANLGKFKDWGYEAQATYNGRAGDFGYHVGGTITFARNKLVDYGATTVLTSGYRSTTQDYPLASIFGLRYGGKIQNEQQLKAYLAKYYPNNGIGMPSNLRVGDNMYCDENGDGVLDEKDYIYLGSDSPEISYSFNFGGSWKGFDVNIVFQGAANRFVYRGINNFTVPFRGIYTNTSSASLSKTFSAENPDPNIYYAPYTTDSNINNYNYQANSQTAQDARYIRLKDVTIGYTFPAALLSKTGFLTSARIYFTGSDLWESTKIKDGWDPEQKRDASGTGRYPFTRNFTFGLNLSF